MDRTYGVAAIVIICLIVLLIGVLKRKAQIVLNFVVRVIVGMICIFFVNNFLESRGISVSVGMNMISALTSGSLGISGVAMLYGISFLKYL